MISRLKNLWEKRGFWGALRLLVRRSGAALRAFLCPGLLLHPRRTRLRLRQSLRGDFDRVILWRSSFGFHAALYQRPQQIARQLAQLRCLVLYEANPLSDRVDTLREQEPGLVLVNLQSPLLRRLLEREAQRTGKPRYLQLYSTERDMPLRQLKGYRRRGWGLIYEYVDHLSPLISGTARLPRRIRSKFAYVMARPEIPVVVTAELLRQDVLRRRGGENLVLVSNGVDYAFFQRWGSFAFEPAFREILGRGKPIVCYYGALAAWLDYGLLRQIAATGRYSLVLIGPKYDGSFDRALGGAPGIDWLGPRDYAVLKYYARAADVLILPFLKNAVTDSASPVKLFEYMALGRPIVSSDVRECRCYASVLIGRDRADFLRQLERALRLREDEAYLALLDREAQANDWREKAAAILRALPDSKKAPEP